MSSHIQWLHVVSFGYYVTLHQLLEFRNVQLTYGTAIRLCRGADKSLAFLISYLQHNQTNFFLDGLKELEQRSHKCVELWGEYVE
jgi:hypothetical protein